MKYRVSQISQSIRDVLEQHLGGEYWVYGELAGYDRSAGKGGHIYATLCEKDPSGNTIAQLSISLFKQNHQQVLERIARSPNPFTLEDGREVCFRLRLDYYPPYGRLSGIVSDIDPIHTLEEAKKRRLEILLNLEKAGIKENNKKLPLPLLVTRIGLITAQKSAAEADFLSELKNSGYAFTVKLCYATMQGKQTEASVLKALDRLYKQDVEVICITRGGGDVTDLQWFDNEKIARSILEHDVPVYSGIGHEIDRCVIDEIAREHYKTPTALARSFVEKVFSFLQVLGQHARTMQESARQYLEMHGHELATTSRSLKTALTEASRHFLLELHTCLSDLRLSFKDTYSSCKYRLASGIEKMRIAPYIIRSGKKQLAIDCQGMRQGAKKILRQCDLSSPATALTYSWKLQLKALHSSLATLDTRIQETDPLKVLKKGYTITTRASGEPLKSGRFKKDEILLTRTFKKIIKSKYMEDTDEGR